MLRLEERAKSKFLVCESIIDAGRTQIAGFL